MSMFGGGALREHMRECLEARKETNRRIDDIDKKLDGSFGEARRKIDERHEQNQKAIADLDKKTQTSLRRLYGGLWRVALTLLGALMASYLAQHGFTAPGLTH
jgi:hypothetical protein